MRRDLVQIIAALLISSSVAVGANLGQHKMEWLRAPLAAPPAEKAPVSSQPRPDGNQDGRVETHDVHQEQRVTHEVVLKHLHDRTASFIDARSADEYAEGHLRGAVSLPADSIFEHIDDVTGQVAPDDLVIVYCGGGGCEASVNVSDTLRRYYQYTRVMIYENGWEEVELMLNEFSDCLEVGSEQ